MRKPRGRRCLFCGVVASGSLKPSPLRSFSSQNPPFGGYEFVEHPIKVHPALSQSMQQVGGGKPADQVQKNSLSLQKKLTRVTEIPTMSPPGGPFKATCKSGFFLSGAACCKSCTYRRQAGSAVLSDAPRQQGFNPTCAQKVMSWHSPRGRTCGRAHRLIGPIPQTPKETMNAHRPD